MAGEPQVLFIEGATGCGRSRLLHELATDAQLKGVCVLRSAATEGGRPYSLAARLCEALLQTCPKEAGALLREHATVLAHLSPVLRAALKGRDVPALPRDPREQRQLWQSSLLRWFSEVSRQRPISLCVDDVDCADEPSSAWLAALGRATRGQRLLMAVTARKEPGHELDATLADLRAGARTMELEPLSQPDTTQLLRSIFGDVPYLERLSERLYAVCNGHPAHCLELSHFLVDEGVVRYAEGGWSLPQELEGIKLPSRSEDGLRRLSLLNENELALARVLSAPHHGGLRKSLCAAVSPLDEPATASALAGLQRAGVLVGSEEHYRFAHDSQRSELWSRLDAAAQASAHRAFADALLASDDGSPLQNLSAANHLLRAGDHERGLPLLRDWSSVIQEDLDALREPMPTLLEEILEMLDERKVDAHGIFAPLTLLACAGYLVHYRYADKYALRARDVSREVLWLNVAQRLRWLLGAKLSLLVALLCAWVSCKRRQAYATPVLEALRATIQMGTWLLAIGATTLDSRRALLGESIIAPFAVLGRQHGAWVAHRMAQGFVSLTRGETARYNAIAREVCERLDDPAPIQALTPKVRERFTVGALTALGSTEGFKPGAGALKAADRIDAYGPAHGLSADQIRLAYYLSRGDRERAEHYRKRVELHAVQFGTCWQMEIWASVGMLRSHCLNRDALAVKRAAQDLKRVAEEVPSLAAYACWGEGEYLLMHHKYQDALNALNASGYPAGSPALLALRGASATALRGLGRYQEAFDACREVLSTLKPEDLEFVLQYYGPQIEYALGHACLGRVEEGRSMLADMRERYGSGLGPVFEGKLNEASGLLELQADDPDAARPFLQRAQRRYRSTNIPSLMAHAEGLGRLARQQESTGIGVAVGEHQGVTDALVTQMHQILSSVQGDASARAREALRIVSEVTEARCGFLVMRGSNPLQAQLGSEAPPAELLDWAVEELANADEDDETALVSADDFAATAEVADVMELGDRRYRVAILRRNAVDGEALAALVLGFESSQIPLLPTPRVQEAIAHHLTRSATARGHEQLA